MVFAAAWYYASEIEDQALAVEHEQDPFDLRVVSIEGGRITLEAEAETASSGRWSEPGIWGLESAGTYNQVERIIEAGEWSRELADHVRGTGRDDRAAEPGGLPLMTTTGGIKIGMTPSHPGAFIRIEAVEEFGLSVAAAARILGVRRATLSDLLNGSASLSPEMAMRVEKAFGLSMDLLLRMQAWYDATQMRARADEIDVRRYQPA